MKPVPPVFEALEARCLLNANWTVLVYLDGDNNLESAAIADVNEMETVGSTPSVNLVVQMDRISGYDNSNGNWTDTRRGLIVKDQNTSSIATPFAGGLGELNMGDPATLTSFIQWGKSTYPADHYALVLWDHGGGTGGVCWDDTSNDNLTVAEVGQALAAANVPLDLVGFDACLMAMLEQAYEIRNYADVMVASEQTEPWDGWPYNTIAADLTANPTQSAATLAGSIVTRYGQSYSGAETMSAVDMTAIGNLAQSLDAFAGAVLAADTDWAAISAARTAAHYYTEPDFRDLGTFISGVAGSAADPGIRAAAQAVQAAYNSAVIANHSSISEAATGLSIYLPAQGGSVSSSYAASNFGLLADTRWRQFLSAFVSSSGNTGVDSNGRISSAGPAGPLPATIVGNIGLDGAQNVGGKDVDFYSVSVTAGQTVGFDIDAKETGGSLDSMLRLFDGSGTELAVNDDAHDPDTNVSSYDSYLEYTFNKSGTYYIAVSGYNNAAYDPWVAGSGSAGSMGAYTLLIRQHAGGADTNGTIPSSVQLGSSPVAYSAAIGDEAVGSKDVDFYAIDVESNQSLTFAVDPQGSGLNAYLRLFNSAGTQLAAGAGPAPQIDYDFSSAGAGTYYVAVSGSPNTSYNPFTGVGVTAGSTGAYTISVAGSSVTVDFNGTIPRANALGGLPADVPASIGDEPAGGVDVDFYRFSVSAGQTIGFDIDAAEQGSGLDAEIQLFDATGQKLASSDDGTDPDSGFAGADPYLTWTFSKAGTYYIAVSGAPNHVYQPFVEASGVSGSTGAYVLQVCHLGDSSDPNGTLGSATTATVPAVLQGEIGDEPAGNLDVDIYSFSAAAGQTMTFDINADVNGSLLDSVLRLFDGAGNEIGFNDDDPIDLWTYDSYLVHTFRKAGTYYIGVSGYGNDLYDPDAALSGEAGSTGAYTLMISREGCDLVGQIDDSALPASVSPGSGKLGRLQKVPVTVTNNGTMKASGSVTIKLYASADRNLDTGTDSLIGSIGGRLNLKPNRSKTLTFRQLKVPVLTAGNSYYLIAQIVPAASIGELDGTNNNAVSVRTVRWLAARTEGDGVARDSVAARVQADEPPPSAGQDGSGNKHRHRAGVARRDDRAPSPVRTYKAVAGTRGDGTETSSRYTRQAATAQYRDLYGK